MNSECQAYSVTTRVGRLCVRVGAADQILHEQVLVGRMREEIGEQRVEMRRRHRACCCPTRRCGSVAASRTMNLSFGERPVCWPV